MILSPLVHSYIKDWNTCLILTTCQPISGYFKPKG